MEQDLQNGHNEPQPDTVLLDRIVLKIQDFVYKGVFSDAQKSKGLSSCTKRTQVRDFNVELYAEPRLENHLNDFKLSSEDRKCVDFSSDHKDHLSSINTNGECVILFAHEDCEGLQTVITSGMENHDNLLKRAFDDETRSMRVC